MCAKSRSVLVANDLVDCRETPTRQPGFDDNVSEDDVVLTSNLGLQPEGRKSAIGSMVKLLRAHGGCLGIRRR